MYLGRILGPGPNASVECPMRIEFDVDYLKLDWLRGRSNTTAVRGERYNEYMVILLFTPFHILGHDEVSFLMFLDLPIHAQ